MKHVRERRPGVLHIINGLGAGGAEALLYRLATRASDFEHEVISLVAPDWYSARLEEHGVKVHYLGIDSSLAAPAGLFRLNGIIRNSGADVVQTWMNRSNLAGGLLARAAGIPVVWGVHCSTFDPLRPVSRLLVRASRLFVGWVPGFVIHCSESSAEIHARLGYGAAPGTVIYNGYDAEEFFPDEESRALKRVELEIDSGTFLIGTIARWANQKDIPNFVRAVKHASDAGVPIRCLLVGTGMERSNADLMGLLREAGCEEIALPLGRRADIIALARALDLHVLASFGSEAFPNVVAETMLSGTPNAVTDIGDMALMAGDTGWVVPPRDPKALGGAIEQAYREWKNHPAEWAVRRSAARERISQRFTFERMAEAYGEVWRKVLRQHQARRLATREHDETMTT